jgi:hypothetical protein
MYGYGQDNTYNDSVSAIYMTGNVKTCRKIAMKHCIFGFGK